MATLFEQIGGDGLREVLSDFYDRVFSDVMIGFLFSGSDKERLIAKEWELTARFLGAEVSYSGRPLRSAHAPHPIMGGHFDRRTRILEETLADHDVPDAVREAWLRHNEELRPLITSDPGSVCDHDAAADRLRSGTNRE